MDMILDESIKELFQSDFDCSCGRRHSFRIPVEIGEGILPHIVNLAREHADGTILVYTNTHTGEAAGERVYELLKAAGYTVRLFNFDTGEKRLHPNEYACGRLLMETTRDVSLLVGVGSGTLNDIGKFASAKTSIPQIIVATAPSMDGYLSPTSSLLCDGFKTTFNTVKPAAVLADTAVIRKAPIRMLWAGYGDAVGKITAVADWETAHILKGEYLCESCVALDKKAVKMVMDCAEDIRGREASAVGHLISALLMTGVGMAYADTSRPASGCEHMLSHYWTMKMLEKGLVPDLHGITVGVAMPVVCELMHELGDLVPEKAMEGVPTWEEALAILRRAGAPTHPLDCGVDRELFQDSLLNAYNVRQRYNAMLLAKESGVLEKIADSITKLYFA